MKTRTLITREQMHKMTPEEKLKRTDFFVEANGSEQHKLWVEWFHENEKPDRLHWEQDGAGFAITVGHIKRDKKMPVTVSFSFYGIGDKYICFYYATSRFVDHTMVEKWIQKRYPVKYDNDTRLAMEDAGNFHNCYHFCQGLR